MDLEPPLKAPAYRAANDRKGFEDHIAGIRHALEAYAVCVIEEQDSVLGAARDLASVESRFTWRESRFGGILGRLDLLREHQNALNRIDRHGDLLVRLRERMSGIETLIEREQEAFYDSPFARKVAQENPRAYARFLERTRRA